MKVDGKILGDAKKFTIEEQFHDWFHDGLSADDVSIRIKDPRLHRLQTLIC